MRDIRIKINHSETLKQLCEKQTSPLWEIDIPENELTEEELIKCLRLLDLTYMGISKMLETRRKQRLAIKQEIETIEKGSK